mmetsp:Transcript_49151/g.112709  ORF Transcript_49151/g.112709 Transcript_49151/m.112709 type:complete len:227 (+) Transcript_49151:1348-2028(+)
MCSQFSVERSPAPRAASALSSSGRASSERQADESRSIPSRVPSSAQLRSPASPSSAHATASASSAWPRPASVSPPSSSSGTAVTGSALNLSFIVDCDEPSPNVSSRVASMPARVAFARAASPRSTGCASRSAEGACFRMLDRSMPCASNCEIASVTASSSSMSSSSMFSVTASSNVSCEMRAIVCCVTFLSLETTPTCCGGGLSPMPSVAVGGSRRTRFLMKLSPG